MSRETESSSSGPKGRGATGYPSGTPPYGTPSAAGQGAPEAAAEPDEPKTETTLTTRIRINIPGSRPIPPVVVRTPMSDTAKPADAEGVSERTGSVPRPKAPEPEPEEPNAEERPPSNWFAPRKSPAAPAPSATPPAGTPRPDLPYFSDGPGSGAPSVDGSGRVDGSDGARPGPPSGPTTGPVTGNAALPVRPVGNRTGMGQGADLNSRTAEGSAFGAGSDQLPGQGPESGRRPGEGPGPDMGFGDGPRPGGDGVRPGQDFGRNPAQGPGAGGDPFAPGGQAPAPALSDDTAILTPQPPAPSPLTHTVGNPLANPAVNPAAPAPGGHVSGDTLTSGIPVVPPEHRGASFPPGPGGPNLTPPPGSDFDFDEAEPPAPPQRTSTPPAPAKKKGRSKLALLGGGLVALVGVAYGAGLVLNHSEVPKGTTVLGVDIGGGTKEAAVSKLDQTLGKRSNQPLHLTVDGKQAQLKPEIAGLSLDSQATVRAAAGSDYNPVSVIGSLFGGKRIAEPVIPVDEEKLGVALTDLAGASGSATEGTIKFVPGKAVAVPGKAGKSLDVNRSMISVKDAYRTMVQTGKADPVALPVAVRQPAITQAEIDRAMKEFAQPAMSGIVTIKAGGKSLPFGPSKSLPKILSMKASGGKLVEVYDKAAITELIGSTFKGIMVTQGGQKHEVSADDVANAMKTALLGKTPAERTATVDLNPS
uniref:Peptidoglycan binding domain-containing protein n=1 Tax=Streptomyces sp. NBC_00003 TaxID=2903608 RepID=A0AAU2V3D4_9ACTN